MTELQAPHADDFRHELHSWLETNLTEEIRRTATDLESDDAFATRRKWNARLYDAGFAAIGFPFRFGGRAAGVLEQLIYNEVMHDTGAPGPVNVIGVQNIAPAILAFGTDEQQERYLRPMLRGEEIWSQGMSEPDAGSDLASLRTRAVADGDDFVVTGQKTWNSLGHRADFCQLYVRTDPEAPRHHGLSCLLIDMHAEGVRAEPIVTLAGGTDFAEVFLDEVRVPRSAVLGEVGGGWAIATGTLSFERAGVANLYLTLRRKFDRLVAAASAAGADGRRPVDDPVRRDQLVARYIEVRNVELLAKRSLGAMLQGNMPGAESSVIKLAWSRAEQALSRTAVDLLGLGALEDGPWTQHLLGSTSLTIAGGTSEVNMNIVGERVLGLPREPKPS